MSIPKLRQNGRKMKPTLANLFNTIATLIYLNVYCFLFVSLKCVLCEEREVCFVYRRRLALSFSVTLGDTHLSSPLLCG